jgi:outer membrane cobalamin receptor
MNVFKKGCMGLGLAALVFTSAAAGAEEKEPRPVRLEEVKVVATPIIEGNEVDRYAGEKTTVGEQQIEDLNAQDLGTALRTTPGVTISRFNPIGSFGGGEGGAVFVRGFGSSRPGSELKMYVDGVPMYMSVWNHPLLDLMTIDPAQAIEVYKSPQPEAFGNAFAAINLMPKQKVSKGIATKVQVQGGSYHTFASTAEQGGKFDQVDYYVGGGYRRSYGHREDAEGRLMDGYGRLGYQINDNWDVSLFTLWDDNSAKDPGKEGASPAERLGIYKTKTWLTLGKIVNRYDNADGHLKIYYNNGNGNWLNEPTSTTGVTSNLYNEYTYYGFKAKENLYLWKGGQVTMGLDWERTEGKYNKQYSTGEWDNWKGHEYNILSPYAAVNHLFGEKSGLYAIPSAGVRFYDNSDFENEWAPHTGVVVGYQDTQVHARYSRGILYPGLDVVVMSEEVIKALGKSWKDLTAEKVNHYELGLSQRFGNFALLEVTGFYEDGKDRYVVNPPPPFPPTYENTEKYKIRGVEAGLSVYPMEGLSLFAGFTYLSTDPGNLPYAPNATITGGLNWRFLNHFQLSLDSQYVSGMYVNSQARREGAENTNKIGSYYLINGKLSYFFPVDYLHMNGEIFLAGENLTDVNYAYQPGYPMPGLMGMLGLRVSF